MTTIFSTKVVAIGDEASEFLEEKMLVTFADNAPDALAPFCYRIEQNPVDEALEVGQSLNFASGSWKITAVGDVAKKNLADLGHVTFVFDGESEPRMPGAIHLEGEGMPNLQVGDSITITK